jgi:hypothetical protein
MSSDGPQAHGKSVEGPRQQGESGSVNFPRRLSRRTTIKKSERKGRRSFNTAIAYGTVAIIGKDADRKIGLSPEGYGPQGGGPRYLLLNSKRKEHSPAPLSERKNP